MMNKDELRQRTVGRGQAIWSDLDADDVAFGNAAVEAHINQLGKDSSRQAIAIVDGAAEADAYNRDRLHALDLYSTEQGRQLAYAKIQTQRQVLTLRTAADLVAVAAQEYGAEVQQLIMLARQAAQHLEWSQVTVARERALMDQKKQTAHLRETEAAISVEILNQQQVRVDIARARLDAARAAVKVIQADIEVQQTELRVVQAQLDLAMTAVDNATLNADIASIYADIITRGLADIRLAVESAEIEAEATFIASKLTDMLAIWSTRIRLEDTRRQYESLLRAQDAQRHDIEWAAVGLDQYQQDLSEEVSAAERAVAAAHQSVYVALKNAMESGRRDTATTKSHADSAVFVLNQAAEAAVTAAHSAVACYTEYQDVEVRRLGETIRKGYLSGGSVSPNHVSVPTLSPGSFTS